VKSLRVTRPTQTSDDVRFLADFRDTADVRRPMRTRIRFKAPPRTFLPGRGCLRSPAAEGINGD